MKHSIRYRLVAALGALALAAVPASAVVNWSNDFGSSTVFSWAGGYEDNGYFGDPVPTPNSLIFNHTENFFATSGSRPATNDVLHVTITVQPGYQITGVTINEFGTRSSLNFTTIQGTLHVTDLTVGSTDTFTSSLAYVGAPAWTGTVTQAVSFNGGTIFHIDLTNNLTAAPFGGQSIAKSGVEIIFTPAPGVLAPLAGGTVLTLAARRRRR